MLKIGVKSNIQKVIASLSAFDETQLPFAVSKALNDTAYEAQRAVRATMPSNFTIRRDWVVQQVKVQGSTKANLTAVVYDDNDFMARQEYGGEKVPVNGRHMLAVPLRSVFPISGIIPNSMRPKNLPNTLTPKGGGRGADTTAVVTIHNGMQFLARVKPGAGKTNRLQFLYRLIPMAMVKPRFEMGETVKRIVTASFGNNFAKAITLAMSTRRTGGASK